jgi:hypothetical protein
VPAGAAPGSYWLLEASPLLMIRSTALFLAPLFVYHWLSHARSESRELYPAGYRRPPDSPASIRSLWSIGFPVTAHRLSLGKARAPSQFRPVLLGMTIVLQVKDSWP